MVIKGGYSLAFLQQMQSLSQDSVQTTLISTSLYTSIDCDYVCKCNDVEHN